MILAAVAPGPLSGDGQQFALLDVDGDWAWGYRRKDHLAGYLAAAALESHPDS